MAGRTGGLPRALTTRGDLVGGLLYGAWIGWKWAPFFVMEWLGAAGIEPHEVMQVLEGAQRWPRPAVAAVNGLRPLTIWGRTRSGRALIVAVRRLDGRDWEIVGARGASGEELVQLEKWEAGRD